MPSAIIDICFSYTKEEEARLMEVAHSAVVRAFKVSPVHRNVTLVVHEPHRLLGRADSPAPERTTNVSYFALAGRSLHAKRELYRLVVDGLAGLGIPPECILVRLHELPPDNFGVRGGQPICDIELGYPVNV